MSSNPSHIWKFFRVGGVDQVTFRNGADLTHLHQLDQKLWMTLAMPTRGIEFDPRTADLLDTDKDGRIRPPEILAAVQWIESAFKDPGDLLKGGDTVALSAIKDPNILAGAKRILANLGKSSAAEISLTDATDTVKIFAETRFNGDGIITIETADDADTKQAITDILTTLGSLPDHSGLPGVDLAKLTQFFVDAATLCAWADQGESDKALTPLGFDKTAAAANAIKAVKAKVDDYFSRCRLAAYDSGALPALNPKEADYLAATTKDLSASASEIASFPIARIEAGRDLPLAGSVNPAWAAALATLASAAITPLLGAGKTSLSSADWADLQAKLAAYDAWTASKPATAVEVLGLPRLRQLLQSGAQAKIADLIKQDAALEGEFNQFASVEKLLRFQKDFHELITNFVNFADFYGKTWAVFQAGTLYLDNRSCNLCIDVADPARHGALAHLSGAFLAYCDISRPGPDGGKRQIVAVFTDGDSDNLMPGRNGLFYDRQGKDWDATITKIVANPISIRQAAWAPYKKVGRLVEDQIAKRSAAMDAAAQQKLAANTAVLGPDGTIIPPKPPEPPKKVDPGTLAAIGLIMTTLLGAVGAIFASIFHLEPWWKIPLVFLAVFPAISCPSMFMAFLKLRKRNLAPILDANGWAINNVAKMNIPFGRSLTDMPKLPAGAERSLADPFAEKKTPWGLYVVLLLVVAAACGFWYYSTHQNAPASSNTTQTSTSSNGTATTTTTTTSPAAAQSAASATTAK